MPWYEYLVVVSLYVREYTRYQGSSTRSMNILIPGEPDIRQATTETDG